MAERRMVSKVISVSEKVNSLSLFGRLLYTWMIPHADDFGRMPGSPAKVRALVVPMGDETTKEVEQVLHDMDDSRLIHWYEVAGEKFIQIENFDEHQQGLQRRTPSKFPAPLNTNDTNNGISAGQYLSAFESDIEEMVCTVTEQNLFLNDDRMIQVERQVRIQNSYLDIVATGEKHKYIFEIKRQRLSNAALDQIIKYRELMGNNAKCLLLGYGLSANFDLERAKRERVNVIVYDDQLHTEQVTLIDVKCRHITLNTELELELNRTESSAATDAHEKTESFYAAYKRVFQRDLTPFNVEELGKYIDDEGFEERVIVRAIERSAGKEGGISLVKKILNDYAAAGAKTLTGAVALDAEYEARKGATTHAKPRASPQRGCGEYDHLSL